MTVRKFRSIEAMKEPRWRTPGDPDLLRILSELWAFAQPTRRRRFPAGVRRYGSIEEMDQDQQRWAEES